MSTTGHGFTSKVMCLRKSSRTAYVNFRRTKVILEKATTKTLEYGRLLRIFIVFVKTEIFGLLQV